MKRNRSAQFGKILAFLCLSSASLFADERFGLFTYRVLGATVGITDYPEDAVGEVVIPAEIDGKPVTTIGLSAFAHCTGLTQITLPGSVTCIGLSAFAYCTGLTGITIPMGVTEILAYAFEGCSGLTNFTIPEGVTDIEEEAFCGCSGLTRITFPDGLTYIGESAFSGCSSLRGIIIPSSVVVIRNAFSGCRRLIIAVFLGDAPTIEEDSFARASDGLTIYYLSTSSGYTSPAWASLQTIRTDQAPGLFLGQISSPSKGVAGVRLTIQPVYGRGIGVEYSPDLSPGSWIELGNFLPADGGSVFIDPDPVRKARPSGYYRAFLRPEVP